MSPEIKDAIQRAKTCAPARCEDEAVCFKLATELERVYEILNVTTPEPTYEAYYETHLPPV